MKTAIWALVCVLILAGSVAAHPIRRGCFLYRPTHALAWTRTVLVLEGDKYVPHIQTRPLRPAWSARRRGWRPVYLPIQTKAAAAKPSDK